MYIEAFTEGKYLDDQSLNEDQFLVVPGCAYAVIDGVTDISGRLVDGMRTGRYASRIVQRAVAEAVADDAARYADPAHLVSRVTRALHRAYETLAIVDEVFASPPRRFGATLTLALDLGTAFRFILVGDSGVRLNGVENIIDSEGLDRVTAVLRQQAYRFVEEAGGDLEQQRRVSRCCSYYGVSALHDDMQPFVDARGLAVLRARSLAQARELFPSASDADLAHLIDHGISGQTRFQNATASMFGYSVFDGFTVPMALVRVFERPRADVRSIELYTDGYFKPGLTPDVAAWEAAFDEVERTDPEKIGPYPSVKGSSPNMRTDDRTLVIVRF
jgi:hypothetical protein